MNDIREQLQKPWVIGVLAFVVGLIIGLVVLGWGLFPVQWSDAAPIHLRSDLKADYLRMAIDSYTVNQNAALARMRFEALGADAPKLLDELATSAGAPPATTIAAFRAAVGAVGAVPQGTQAVTEATQAAPVTTPAARSTGASFIRTALPVMCVVLVLLAAGLIAFFVLRSRQGGERTLTPAMQAQEAAKQAEYTDYSATGEQPPMFQSMASYKLGDDLFDDSFSIDSPAGEFLGECGVGISETIGVGEPKKVTAFEVWLFDKNDIQTVTKVLMSSHAFGDETIRQRLAAKGEPILVEPGTETVLETQTLRLVVRVVDMGYGDGALPSQSFFDRVILELAVWPK
jgi:hypothetical protein